MVSGSNPTSSMANDVGERALISYSSLLPHTKTRILSTDLRKVNFIPKMRKQTHTHEHGLPH